MTPVLPEQPAVAGVELLLPPPAPELAERTMTAARNSSGRMGRAGTANRELPPPESSTGAARASVTEPGEQADAEARAGLTAALREQPQPSPEIEQLCADIQDAIENKRPVDEASLRRADPEADAQAVGDQLNGDIREDGERVGEEYDSVNVAPEVEAPPPGETLPEPAARVETPVVNAAAAAPAPTPPENLDLSADVENSERQMEEAGMNSEPARLGQDPSVLAANEGLGELETTAAEAPAEVMRQEAEAIAGSRAAMRELQDNTLNALEASRGSTIGETLAAQLEMAGSEEEQRVAAATAADAVFNRAREAVNDQLEPMVTHAMDLWETGKARIVGDFDRTLERAKRAVDDRHEGVSGAIVSIWDDVTGLPAYITDMYTAAERTFGREICALIREISTYVNGIVIACEEIIDNADEEIAGIFDLLPASLQGWAEEQRSGFRGQLDGLRDQVHDTQQRFTEDLVNQAGDATQEARERIDALREAAQGLIQKVAAAVAAFLEDPATAIINGLLMVVGIDPAAFWAMLNRIGEVKESIAEDPMVFGNNLMEALGMGFDNFFSNFFSHLLGGFINWLMSAMGSVGVELPPDTSLKSILTFFLQVMGLTWANIRVILVRHVGEQNVELLEKAYELVNLLIEEGPGGIFEMIKEQLDPAAIMNTVIEAAVSYMVEAIVSMATVRIIGLFNPVGAIFQVIEAIYKVLKWVFENAARIFELVNTVVNGVADIIAGNIAGMAEKTENALAGMLVPVIDFVAGFLGLGDLPEKIAEVVGGFQQTVLAAVDRAIGFIIRQARGLLSALGIGGGADGDEDGADAGALDTEVGESMRFSADGEAHRLWIDTAGSGVEVMVASNEEKLEDRVRRWNTEVGTIADPDEQARARELLPQVSRQLGITEQEAEQADDAIEEATDGSVTPEETAAAEQADEEATAAQALLVPQLRELFTLFGEQPDLTIFDPDVNRMAPNAVADVRSELAAAETDYLAAADWTAVRALLLSRPGSGVEPLHERPLGRSDLRRPFHTGNFDDVFLPGAREALAATATERDTTVAQLLTKREVTISEEDYAGRRRGAVHGTEVPQGENEAATPAQALLGGLQRGLFAGYSIGGLKALAKAYFLKSLTGFKPHSDYKPDPVSYRIQDGKFKVSYSYDDPDDSVSQKLAFEIEFALIPTADGVVSQTTTGRNLRLKTPNTRGITRRSGQLRDAETFVDPSTGETISEIDSSHVLGDQFMGSGYEQGLNLIVTSANYNRKSMAREEREVARLVDSSRFDLRVEAQWKTFSDSSTSEQLAAYLDTTSLHDTTQDNLEDSVRALLQGEQDPRVVLDVFYTPTLLDPHQPLATLSIDAYDSWLADQLGYGNLAGYNRAG